MKVLAVVPARGGSKRIHRKNLRLMHGRPLISYVLESALSAPPINAVVVTSDDESILEYAGALCDRVLLRQRPAELAGDEVTLDPVVFDAVLFAERELQMKFDVVITLQPTSPTLSRKTLKQAIEAFVQQSAFDTCIAVTEDIHLRWEQGSELRPLYEKRLNRQWLPKTYRETGAFVISRRENLSETSRFGKKITVYPLPPEEAVDIDDSLDWTVAEALLARRRIAIVVNGNRTIGLGHVYRTLTLADIFFGNEVQFYTYQSDESVIELMRRRGCHVEITDQPNLLDRLAEFKPQIVINDILDTSAEYIELLRSKKYFVVNFEDLGEGSECAHLVFNALYELSRPPAHHRFGAQYVCLSPQFLLSQPAPFRADARTLLITFGGADENNLTLSACKTLGTLFETTALEKALIVLGPGYAHEKELSSFLSSLDKRIADRIEVHRVVQDMASMMRRADCAVTSNGRTVYELASMGVPGIAIAQNDRETLHLFSRYSKGFIYLGISSLLKQDRLCEALLELVQSSALRKKMREVLLETELRSGANRVKREIWESYWRWQDEQDHPR